MSWEVERRQPNYLNKKGEMKSEEGLALNRIKPQRVYKPAEKIYFFYQRIKLRQKIFLICMKYRHQYPQYMKLFVIKVGCKCSETVRYFLQLRNYQLEQTEKVLQGSLRCRFSKQLGHIKFIVFLQHADNIQFHQI